MQRSFPTAAEVRQLPILTKQLIPPEWEDQNGHVNVQFYLALYEMSGWPLLESLGIDRSYFEERRLGIFDLEHHIRYLNELHVGDAVTLHGRMLSRNDKRMHGMLFIVNDERHVLAATLEYVASSANLLERRTDAFPGDVAERLDALIEADRQLSWPAPVCGVMSV